MFILSSTIIINCFYILMILCLKSSCGYIDDSNELTNSFNDQQTGLNLPLYYDRYIRTTKFPRIGRSLLDNDEILSLYDINTSSEENSNEINDNDIKSIEKRSVLFPRIGKRAFHNLLWANSRSNPHRMLDSDGRYYLNGYDYHVHHAQPKSIARYRGKRNNPM